MQQKESWETKELIAATAQELEMRWHFDEMLIPGLSSCKCWRLERVKINVTPQMLQAITGQLSTSESENMFASTKSYKKYQHFVFQILTKKQSPFTPSSTQSARFVSPQLLIFCSDSKLSTSGTFFVLLRWQQLLIHGRSSAARETLVSEYLNNKV